MERDDLFHSYVAIVVVVVVVFIVVVVVVVVVLVVVVPVFVVLAVADASNKRLPSCGVSDRLRSVQATCALALHTYSSASYTNT